MTRRLSLTANAAFRMTEDQKLAFNILSSGKLTQAFCCSENPTTCEIVTDAIHSVSRCCWLVDLFRPVFPIVQANMGPVQNWDSHQAIFRTMTGRLISPLDHAVSALLDDLDETVLLNDTMVMVIGEFGRTPKINAEGGRDHWARVLPDCSPVPEFRAERSSASLTRSRRIRIPWRTRPTTSVRRSTLHTASIRTPPSATASVARCTSPRAA